MLKFHVPFSGSAPAPDRLYRSVLADAWKLAWAERRFWPIAFCAAILLTMGSYDVVLTTSQTISEQAMRFGSFSTGAFLGGAILDGLNGASGIFGILSTVQVLGIASILLLAMAVLSCVCQGGLVYAMGAMRRGDQPGIRTALRVGAAAIWPVVALNALSLMSLCILRFLAAFGLYLVLGIDSPASYYIYLIAYGLFLVVSFIVAIVQIFALNAMILQGAPVGTAIVRGYELFKRHWLVALETAAMLFLVAFLLTLGFGILLTIMIFPFTMAVMASAVLAADSFYHILMGAGFALLLLAMASLLAFITQLQYATWTILYRRLGEGGIIPKVHRLYRDLTGTYTVPQA